MKKGLGGEQIEGRHAVRELLMAGSRRVREVVLADDLDPAAIIDEIVVLADEAKVSLKRVPRKKFEAAARTTGPQGVMASAAALEPVALAQLIESSPVAPFLLLVDGVTDPGNLGALLRTAECAGVTGVVLPRHRAVHITPTVAKAAAGAIEHLRFATVSGLPAAISELSAMGVWTVGLDVASEHPLWDFSMATDPVALVLGAEGKGMSRLVRERCDLIVTIPMAGSLESLNVSAAGALAMFEVTRARRAQPQP